MTNDLLIAADAGSQSLLILLNLTAAFDIVDHTILLERLHTSTGLSDRALQWFQSYLSDRTEYVSLGGRKSRSLPVTSGIPQGSVLGPIVFIIYMLPVGRVISKHGISFHCYTDDTQLYIKTAPNPSAALSPPVSKRLSLHFLQLNSNKTEALLNSTPYQIQSLPLFQLSFDGQIIPLSSSAINLGISLDAHVTYKDHIQHLCKTSFLHLCDISRPIQL